MPYVDGGHKTGKMIKLARMMLLSGWLLGGRREDSSSRNRDDWTEEQGCVVRADDAER